MVATLGLSEFPQDTVTVPHVAVGLEVGCLACSCEGVKLDGLLVLAGQLFRLPLLEVVFSQHSIGPSVSIAGLCSDLVRLRSFFKLRFHQYLITEYSPHEPTIEPDDG